MNYNYDFIRGSTYHDSGYGTPFVHCTSTLQGWLCQGSPMLWKLMNDVSVICNVVKDECTYKKYVYE